ncbi:hemerythrin domain-containing protein [Streptosporangium lutulentum]|uniref:Iron-sulfur cluster repair protein YtfE (RIC family) n=1 Tax=Streptosporangium lutulentum TaxID=1461250 RepID=A0ABT9QC59_9ACTN|nr:hemerythrin domain-containing protein [Streptosporangium lutulentum]MDP9844352.1 iron-sulfur cluster repair protein YtfE (RIC family) [Streptosporangium lutulentum]
MTSERLIAWGDELVKLHDGFRGDLAELRRSRGTGLGTGLREHCLTFCEALHLHHTGEDNVLFPHLADRHPELADVLARLRSEHHVVARLLAQVRALVATGDADAIAAELDRLTGELERHLDYEEEQLVPLLNQMTDMPEDL